MQSILDLIQEGPPMMQPDPRIQQSTPPKPDEVAQIVVQGLHGPGVILRFKTEKKARDVYNKLQVKWRQREAIEDRVIVDVVSDMFDTTVDLSKIAFFSLVVHKVAKKFVPIP